MLLRQTGPMPPYSTVAYIIMQICHFCGMHNFVSGPSFQLPLYSRHTTPPGWKHARPRRGASGAGHGHAPSGSAPILAACAGRGQLQVGRRRGGGGIRGRLLRRGRPWGSAPAAAMSCALAGVAVVDVFFAAAVRAGGARLSHVPRARRRRYCGPLLRRGRARR